MRYALLLALFLLPDLMPVKELDSPITNKVLFVLDISGTMRNNGERNLNSAIGRFREMAEDSTDEFRFGVIAFNGETYRWPGYSEDNLQGWAIMPNPEAIEEARSWISSCPGLPDTTDCGRALSQAFADPEEELTIILLTDGIFNGPADNALPVLIPQWQGARAKPAKFIAITYGYLRKHLETVFERLGVDAHYHEQEPD
jgi:Mg-chelatase subunit ChlD